MSSSLKDALIKAGIVSQDVLDREKENERRDKIQRKGPSQEGIHAHHIRTDCANCGKTSPDVEYYEHTNRSIIAKWLCIPCADKAWIKDETRQTNQSSHAKAGKFRREFGATKKFPQAQAHPSPGPSVSESRKSSPLEKPENKPSGPRETRPAQVLKPGQKFIPPKKNQGSRKR